MEPVDPDDERARFRKPPPPPDRVWLHPSEMAQLPKPVEERRMAPVVVATAVVASLLSGGLVLVAVGMLERSGSRPVQRAASRVPLVGGSSAADIVERLRPSIAQVRVGQPPVAVGSGVIFRDDGHLLTSAHLVEEAADIVVVLHDRREMRARLLGADEETDSAVLKVDGDGLEAAPLGSASRLRVGEPVLALGVAVDEGAGAIVTSGVVSALHRRVRARSGAQVLADVVQIDAPLAAGAAGGALLDGTGEVVGLVSAVATEEAGAAGMTFATPVQSAQAAAEELVSAALGEGGWLGILGDDFDEAGAGVPEGVGARVVEVRDGSPASSGGLADSDVIVEIDGRSVSSMRQLVAELRDRRPGDRVSLGVMRGPERLTVEVVLAERPAR